MIQTVDDKHKFDQILINIGHNISFTSAEHDRGSSQGGTYLMNMHYLTPVLAKMVEMCDVMVIEPEKGSRIDILQSHNATMLQTGWMDNNSVVISVTCSTDVPPHGLHITRLKLKCLLQQPSLNTLAFSDNSFDSI